MRECAHDSRCPQRPEAWDPPETGVKDSPLYKSKTKHALNCCPLSTPPRYAFKNLLNVKLFKIGAGKAISCYSAEDTGLFPAPHSGAHNPL